MRLVSGGVLNIDQFLTNTQKFVKLAILSHLLQRRQPLYSIALASSNELKLRAVHTAIQSTRAQRWQMFNQGIRDLPIQKGMGIDQTTAHAVMWASRLAESFPTSFCISIIDGIGQTCERFFDFSSIAILMPDSSLILTQSPWFEIPSDIVQDLKDIGINRTYWGTIAASLHGGDSNDPHRIITRGKLSRVETLAAGVRAAIVQIAWEKYPSSPPQPIAPAK